MFRRLVVEIDNKLEAPEVLFRAVAPPEPVFYYRMSQKDYETMPCLPKPENWLFRNSRPPTPIFLTAPDFVGQSLWPPSEAAIKKLCNQFSWY